MLLLAVNCAGQSTGLYIDSSARLRPMFSIELSTQNHSDIVEREDFQRLLALFLTTNGAVSSIPVSGRHELKGDTLFFRPTVALGEGLQFMVRYVSKESVNYQKYHTPPAALEYANPPKVLKVFPAADELPENILCFHVLFDRPMVTTVDAYKQARIYCNGEEVPLVWKHQAYWTQNNQLLVLMVHPGRVKRGIDYLGKAFESGNTYTLVIAQDITDLKGRKITQSVEKEFRIVKADHRTPKVKKGGIVFPETTNIDPIDVTFSEAMDHACMVEGLEVIGPSGERVPVGVEWINDDRFRVVPQQNWVPGEYQVVFNKVVGDLSGNRFHKKFETRKKPRAAHTVPQKTFSFTIK